MLVDPLQGAHVHDAEQPLLLHALQDSGSGAPTGQGYQGQGGKKKKGGSQRR
jgi:hypothetical protein